MICARPIGILLALNKDLFTIMNGHTDYAWKIGKVFVGKRNFMILLMCLNRSSAYDWPHQHFCLPD